MVTATASLKEEGVELHRFAVVVGHWGQWGR